MGQLPAGQSSGTITDTRVRDAAATRARVVPIATSGVRRSSPKRSSPSSETTAPGHASGGTSAVRRGDTARDGFEGRGGIARLRVAHASTGPGRGGGLGALDSVHGRLRIVELDVPVQVVAPALRSIAEADRNPERRRRLGTARRHDEPHPCLFGRTPAFPPVARHAAGDDVLPVLPPALRNRDNVVEGEVAGGSRVAAILAAVMVARVDVGARERHVVETPFDADIAEQADDGRQLEADRYRPHFTVVHRDDLDLALTPQR